MARPTGVVLDGATIRRLRLRRGWSREDLATRAEITERTVRAAESGRRVAHRTLYAIAVALDLPVDVLVLEHCRCPTRPS